MLQDMERLPARQAPARRASIGHVRRAGQRDPRRIGRLDCPAVRHVSTHVEAWHLFQAAPGNSRLHLKPRVCVLCLSRGSRKVRTLLSGRKESWSKWVAVTPQTPQSFAPPLGIAGKTKGKRGRLFAGTFSANTLTATAYQVTSFVSNVFSGKATPVRGPRLSCYRRVATVPESLTEKQSKVAAGNGRDERQEVICRKWLTCFSERAGVARAVLPAIARSCRYGPPAER
jgi:hypothetical protein